MPSAPVTCILSSNCNNSSLHLSTSHHLPSPNLRINGTSQMEYDNVINVISTSMTSHACAKKGIDNLDTH